MPWLICGSMPDESVTLAKGVWRHEDGRLKPIAQDLPELGVERGTPALLGTVCIACEALGLDAPEAWLCGDTGSGKGSRALYAALADGLPGLEYRGITFHDLFPEVDGHGRVLNAIDAMQRRPLLVADAGWMYVAKMSGYAESYDVFTPDAGEMAFLADEVAPHPFFTRGFLLGSEDGYDVLAERAYRNANAAGTLLIKGATDVVACKDGVVGEVAAPQVPAMEAIGGTGDLVTGLVTALLMAGRTPHEACLSAARAARLCGKLANPTPATQIAEILPHIPEALRLVHCA